MYERFIMTTDPDRFPIDRVREIVNYLHENDQHYIVMVDPAVAYQEQKYDNLTYTSFTIPRDNGYFVYKNGSVYKGVVWPGVTAFPDWFHPEVQQWWNDEFASFFDANTGIDIDGLWIDMNEYEQTWNRPIHHETSADLLTSPCLELQTSTSSETFQKRLKRVSISLATTRRHSLTF